MESKFDILEELYKNIHELRGEIRIFSNENTLIEKQKEHDKLVIQYKRLIKEVNIFSTYYTEISIDVIVGNICKYYMITEERFHSITKKREIVQARQIASYLAVKMIKPRLSNIRIGLEIGNKDPATVLHSVKTVKNLMFSNIKVRKQIEEIEKEIKDKII